MNVTLKPKDPEVVAFFRKQGKWLILTAMAVVLIFLRQGPAETLDAVKLRFALAMGAGAFCALMAVSNWRDWHWQHVSGFHIDEDTFQLLVRGAERVRFANLQSVKFEADVRAVTYTLKTSPEVLRFMDLTAFSPDTLRRIFCYFKDAMLLYKFRLEIGGVVIDQS